jgi:hypothetical protein
MNETMKEPITIHFYTSSTHPSTLSSLEFSTNIPRTAIVGFLLFFYPLELAVVL